MLENRLTSSFPVPTAPSDAEGSLGFYPGGKGQDFIFPAREGKHHGSWQPRGRCRDPGAFSTSFKVSPSPDHKHSVTGIDGVCKNCDKAKSLLISFLFWASPFHLGTVHGELFSLFSGKDIHGSLFPLSLLLAVSFPAGEQWSRWLVSTAFLQQGKRCHFKTSKDFTSW